ncbi:MAG: ABC transporter ATP-binding protein [Clostridia bacterium]|nr:ABC transporter ATP-binding protein [Clostridia bacterium]NLS84516.1 ABC transporter ATP-binding protein [Oscillospiraceae bacterium]
MSDIITAANLTKDYGGGKGVFDVSFGVKKGEAMGFLGPNGAGKTTTLRQLMGFTRPDGGTAEIFGLDCFANAAKIQKNLGYLPGEIAFMDDMTGMEFIKFIAAMKSIKDMTRANELISYFELDASGRIKKMSKGMKQKIGIVCAFMQSADLLLLDEPTSGLDPLMQKKFIDLILREKQRGATILMSSHLFEEIERTCDRTVIIRAGRIAAIETLDDLRKRQKKSIEIEFANEAGAKSFASAFKTSADGCNVNVLTDDINALIKALGGYDVKNLMPRTQTLEELFMHFYGGEK